MLNPKLALLLLALLFAQCGGAATNTNSNQGAATAASPAAPLTGFEKDLQSIRNGQFGYIWVFSRKDGKPLDKDDSAYLRVNAPQVVDWVITDGGRKVIDRKSTRLNSSHLVISYAVFCLKKKKTTRCE